MNRQQFERGIAASWSAVQVLELGETYSNGGSLNIQPEFRNLVLDPESSYEDMFLYALQNSCYNFLLSDHSFFQFNWFANDDVRYAYYPNPYLGANATHLLRYKRRVELFENQFIDYEDFLQLLGEAIGRGRVPVVRYENAPGQYKELNHPCSHLHIGLHGDDRWPVRRLLTPDAFCLIMLRNYHGEAWRGSELDADGRFTKLDLELSKARNDSKLLAPDFFTAVEERTFHLF
jgi:hypothetical protein